MSTKVTTPHMQAYGRSGPSTRRPPRLAQKPWRQGFPSRQRSHRAVIPSLLAQTVPKATGHDQTPGPARFKPGCQHQASRAAPGVQEGAVPAPGPVPLFPPVLKQPAPRTLLSAEQTPASVDIMLHYSLTWSLPPMSLIYRKKKNSILFTF